MENNPHIIHAPTLHSHIHRLFTAKIFIHLCSCTQHKHTQHHKSSVDVCSPSHPTPLRSDFPRLAKKKHQQKLASMVNNTDSVAQRNLISSSVRVNLEPIFSFSLVLPLLRCSDHKIRDCEIKNVYETKDRNYRCSWIPYNFSFKYNQLNSLLDASLDLFFFLHKKEDNVLMCCCCSFKSVQFWPMIVSLYP